MQHSSCSGDPYAVPEQVYITFVGKPYIPPTEENFIIIFFLIRSHPKPLSKPSLWWSITIYTAVKSQKDYNQTKSHI